MRKILLIGAGRSSRYLIQYLLQHAEAGDWMLRVADVSEESARMKIESHPRGSAVSLDIHHDQKRKKEIEDSDLVISLLPADLHLSVAQDCVAARKNMLTASYVSDGMRLLQHDAVAAGVALINECGLDPGIDHMSAMKVIHEIRAAGGELSSFKSYTGGLVAPESNDNP